jgi:hypothetical protein
MLMELYPGFAFDYCQTIYAGKLLFYLGFDLTMHPTTKKMN